MHVQVSGFPTLKLVKPDRTIVPYTGDRSKEDLIAFVEKVVSGGAEEGAMAGGAEYDDEL